jgi:hypothetical protein
MQLIQVIYYAAALLLLVSQVWLVILGFKRSGLMWAVLIAFFSLIAGLAFCVIKKVGWVVWGLNVVAWFSVIALYRNWL